MPIGEDSGPIHPDTTRKYKYRYLFSNKHHGRGGSKAAQWLPTLSDDEEFSVFDEAVFHGISDQHGRLYGVRITTNQEVLYVGTLGEQIAIFPHTRPGETWHGYPLWPLREAGPANKQGEDRRPSKEVFQKMEERIKLKPRDRKRLWKGNHA